LRLALELKFNLVFILKATSSATSYISAMEVIFRKERIAEDLSERINDKGTPQAHPEEILRDLILKQELTTA
jgi:hypothetical protein